MPSKKVVPVQVMVRTTTDTVELWFGDETGRQLVRRSKKTGLTWWQQVEDLLRLSYYSGFIWDKGPQGRYLCCLISSATADRLARIAGAEKESAWPSWLNSVN